MKRNHGRARSVHTSSRLRSCFKQKKSTQAKPKRNLILQQYDNNTMSLRRERISSICSSTKKQKCITPKQSAISNTVSSKNCKLTNKRSKQRDKVFVFSQRRRTRKASRGENNGKYNSRAADKLNATINVSSPLASEGLCNLRYVNLGKQFPGNKALARATMTNTLLSPNLMSTLNALKKRNNSLGLVNKFNTLNNSSGALREPMQQQKLVECASEAAQEALRQNDKE